MRFEKQLFISYAHLDNQPLTEGQKGWVTQFHSALQAILDTRLGRRSVIWRDDRLRGNMDFNEEIVAQFPHTAVMVSVLSPRYVESKSCRQEVNEFAAITRQNSTREAPTSQRFFKVIKTPVGDEGELPDEITKQLGYPFYRLLDEQTPLELDPSLGEEPRRAFIQELARLAWDIANRIKQLEAPEVDTRTVENDGRPPLTIYLAECAYDRQEDRAIIDVALRQRGYRVIPERPLPRDEESYVQIVRNMLEDSHLSVHLIGTGYGSVPDGPSEKSVTILQNELAAQRVESGGLKRIISMPNESEVKQNHQREFIGSLHFSPVAQRGADLLPPGMEALKTAIFSELTRIGAALNDSGKEIVKKTKAVVVYIICTQSDRKGTVPLVKQLKSEGVECLLPVFSGDAHAVRTAHEEQLRRCDVVLLYYGDGDESWVYAQRCELQKVLASPELSTPLAFMYLAAPDTEHKDWLVAAEEPNLFDFRTGVSAEQLASLQKVIEAISEKKLKESRDEAD